MKLLPAIIYNGEIIVWGAERGTSTGSIILSSLIVDIGPQRVP